MFYLPILKERAVIVDNSIVVLENINRFALEGHDRMGVAFLVKTEGKTIYHAGDLHWWDWPGEPEEDNKMMEQLYKAEMEYLKAEKIDCAFVVLDPRQEESGSLGMEYFIKNVGAHFIFPMHCWEQYDIIEKYKKDVDRKFLTGQIMNITAPGQQFVLD